MAKECRRKWRGDADLALLKVRFALGNNGIFLNHIVLGVAYGDDGEEQHLGGVDFALIEQTCIGNKFLQFGNTSFEMALGFLSGIVLGIFAEVALVACLGNGGRCGGTLDGYEVVQFVFQFLQSFFTVLFDFCHNSIDF